VLSDPQQRADYDLRRSFGTQPGPSQPGPSQPGPSQPFPRPGGFPHPGPFPHPGGFPHAGPFPYPGGFPQAGPFPHPGPPPWAPPGPAPWGAGPQQWGPSAGPRPPQDFGPPVGWIPVHAKESGRRVYVNPADVLRQPLTRGSTHIGYTFRMSPNDLNFDRDWAARTGPTDSYMRTLPHQSGSAAEAAALPDAMTRMPWWRDFRNGGRGPIVVTAHGRPDWMQAVVRAGSVVWDGQAAIHAGELDSNVSGTSAWRLLRSIRGFNDLLARRVGASIAAVICSVADGRFSDDFVIAMRQEGFGNEAHFGHNRVFTVLDDNFAIIGTEYNGGFDTVLGPDRNGYSDRVRTPGTRYSREEIIRHAQEAARRRQDDGSDFSY
jgi:hypothetical protein